jgi:hypothetical protein
MSCVPLVVSSKINYISESEGVDSLNSCRDKKYWKEYPHNIVYQYNSRGFRDQEWPEDLKSAIWCVGDSFTLGLGQPYHHIWPVVLSKQLNINTVNISMNGASNDWMTDKIKIICQQVAPKIIIVQWSHIHRRQDKNIFLTDEERRIHYNEDNFEDFENTIDCIKSTEDNKQSTNIIHSYIPKFGGPKELLIKKLIRVKFPKALIVEDNKPMDLARDCNHYDIITAKKYVNNYINEINLL